MRQAEAVKSLFRLIVLVLLSGPAALPAKADFSSLYVWGDGVTSTTTTSNQPTAYYYGKRYCNGRVWAEVLAQRQGVTLSANNNKSYLWHTSDILVTDANQFSATDASSALFVIWVNDADFVWDMTYIYPSVDPTAWNNAINSSLNHHSQAITTLYGKGARTFVMPNAVDTTKVPYYGGLILYPSDATFIRQKVIAFNTGLASLANQLRATLPGIRIIVPDFFSLLDNMLANPSYYGLRNPYTGAYALNDGYTSLSNAPGTTYVFWDYQDPTAKAQEVMADLTQQLLSPAQISNVVALKGSNRLDVLNNPGGLGGFVDGKTNLSSGNWTLGLTNFISTNATQSIFVQTSGQPQFYRLRFPLSWTWP
jgi:hypothetical protein